MPLTAVAHIAERIIVPLDVPRAEDAIALIDRIPDVRFWKVGLELFVSAGPQILQALRARNKKIFLDLKFHDIPNTMAGACRSAAGYGIDLLTVHATAGKAALKAAQQAAVEGAQAANVAPPTLLAVTALTSISTRALAFELKIPLEMLDYVQQMACLSQDSGIGGCVCSPLEVEGIRQVSESLVLVCPGVRPTWAEKGDQQRVMTPGQAVQAGANYLVIGRPITQAEEPARAFEQICSEIQDAAGENGGHAGHRNGGAA